VTTESKKRGSRSEAHSTPVDTGPGRVFRSCCRKRVGRNRRAIPQARRRPARASLDAKEQGTRSDPMRRRPGTDSVTARRMARGITYQRASPPGSGPSSAYSTTKPRFRKWLTKSNMWVALPAVFGDGRYRLTISILARCTVGGVAARMENGVKASLFRVFLGYRESTEQVARQPFASRISNEQRASITGSASREYFGICVHAMRWVCHGKRGEVMPGERFSTDCTHFAGRISNATTFAMTSNAIRPKTPDPTVME